MVQLSGFRVNPAALVIHGDDARVDGLKEELRGLEQQEDVARAALEVLEREEQELRSQQGQARQYQDELNTEKAMYNTKRLDVLIRAKEKEIADLEREVQRIHKQQEELKAKEKQAHNCRMEQAKHLKDYQDKVSMQTLSDLYQQCKLMKPCVSAFTMWKYLLDNLFISDHGIYVEAPACRNRTNASEK